MSRSHPHEHGAPNPAIRWFEWNGEKGVVKYYDKEQKETVEVGNRFGFVLLDQLGTVKGWHEPSQSGIYANEVRDTRQDVLVVKAFKGGLLAQGLYKDIKDRVNVAGGSFVANCYIAFKHGDGMALGSIQFKGSGLRAWMEFCKEQRALLYTQAIDLAGSVEGKKGRVIFRTPILRIKELSEKTNKEALELDKGLQEYLTGYLSRTKRDQVDSTATDTRARAEDVADHIERDRDEPPIDAPYDDEIPFGWVIAIALPSAWMASHFLSVLC